MRFWERVSRALVSDDKDNLDALLRYAFYVGMSQGFLDASNGADTDKELDVLDGKIRPLATREWNYALELLEKEATV